MVIIILEVEIKIQKSKYFDFGSMVEIKSRNDFDSRNGRNSRKVEMVEMVEMILLVRSIGVPSKINV